jgi:hypothetical protein
MKKFENLMSFDEYNESLNEKWDEDVEVEKTGEYADKTIEELEKELEKLKKDPNKTEVLKKKEHQINFALRAKRNWPKKKKEKE